MNNDVELIPVKGVLPSVQVQSDNVVYIPQAHKNKAGIVKEGDGVLIENGVVSLNKQTVEDMIDANKWVSYGFKQNLTEDEKGMARHNIGAGDNYFTGSYYDLTQKPHLNTNNTAGLDYGDEELNDTINLHKISKTGSFNDLKHVPQETLDFAESERQKSKNLFPNETVGGTTYTKITLPSPLKVGTYTLSLIATSSDTDVDRCVVSFQGDSDKFLGQVNLGRNTRTNGTITLSETCYSINFYAGTSYANSNGDTFTYSDIQIEEGSVATDYQPYNGQITHNGDAPVVFAEVERQKSKNLLLVVDSSATIYDYTMTCKDGVFTINGGNGTDESTFILSGTGGVKSAPTKYYQSITLDNTNSIKLSAGTYTISATIPNAQMGILYGDLGTTSQSGASSRSLGANITLTFTKTTYVCVYRYLTGSAMTNVSLGSLQIEEGSFATDYQPYQGGEFVQEGEIADVEHIEVLYDKTSSNANINKGLTSGIPFDNTTELNLGANLSNKYKGIYVYITIWNVQLRIYCDIAYSQERYSFLGYDINTGDQTLVMGCVSIAKSTGILKGTKLISGNVGGPSYSTITDGKYNIYKVEGVR